MAKHTQQAQKTAPAPSKAPENVASAKPGTKDEKARKTAVKRVAYPGLLDAEGKDVKLKSIPTDFNPKLHKPLGRKDFEDESNWFEIRARDLEAKAADMRRQGEESKKLGNVKDRAKAKRLLKMQKVMAELTAELSGQGINVEELLAGATAAIAGDKAAE